MKTCRVLKDLNFDDGVEVVTNISVDYILISNSNGMSRIVDRSLNMIAKVDIDTSDWTKLFTYHGPFKMIVSKNEEQLIVLEIEDQVAKFRNVIALTSNPQPEDLLSLIHI
eukprot:TRINITY_DN20272_c0_g1_i1.p1 TRINITY_DN20272_c0_g1~~TRINITY_DN20272_c0_g1_i1.p1  ORF type:complete len:111 (-),score=22.35 TRINITY_DN20272_c0_g1_i1:59-391(-)